MDVPAKVSAREIAAGEFAAVERFVVSALEGAYSTEAVREALASAPAPRVMGAWSGSELIMVVPFTVTPDGMGQIGVPVAPRRSRDLAAAALAAVAAEIENLGASFVHAAVEPGDPLEESLAGAGLVPGSLMLEMAMETPGNPPAAPGRWILYGKDKRRLFAGVFYATLEASADAVEAPACKDPDLLMRSFEDRGEWMPEDFVLYEHQGRAAGILLVAFAGDSAEIVYLGVRPDVRGRGIGKLLGSRAVQRAAARGARLLRVTVDSRNAAAIAVYRRMGFSEKRAVRIYYVGKKFF